MKKYKQLFLTIIILNCLILVKGSFIEKLYFNYDKLYEINIEKTKTSRGYETLPVEKIIYLNEISINKEFDYEIINNIFYERQINKRFLELEYINNNKIKLKVDLRFSDLRNMKGDYFFLINIDDQYIPIKLSFDNVEYDFIYLPIKYYIDNTGYVEFEITNKGNTVIDYNLNLITFDSTTGTQSDEIYKLNSRSLIFPNETINDNIEFFVLENHDLFIVFIEYLKGHNEQNKKIYERILLELRP